MSSREKFYAWCAEHCVYLNDADDAEKAAKAIFRAGQEAMRERAAAICNAVSEHAEARYKGRLPDQERGTSYNPVDEGRADGAADCEDRIRALPVED